jgi:hypothetical protein
MTDIERIVAGLSVAQRRTLQMLDDAARLPSNATFNANAAFNMICRGLTYIVFDKRLLRDRYCLTHLGLAVRQHLLQQEAGNG